MKDKSITRRKFINTTATGTTLLAGTCLAQPVSEQRSVLVKDPQVKRNFNKDGRSKQVVFLAHCAINQNARHYDCADFPAFMDPLLDALQENQVGIVQMKCPEMMAIGLGRDRDVPPLETITDALELDEGQHRLRLMAEEVIYMIKEYQYQGFHILGILGKNGSPSCGVTEITNKKFEKEKGEGEFIRILRLALEREGIEMEIKGIDDFKQEESIDWIKERLV